jgi:DnaJ-class molecular chaperone
VLSDAKKKERYDSGADIDELEGGGGFGELFLFISFFFNVKAIVIVW